MRIVDEIKISNLNRLHEEAETVTNLLSQSGIIARHTEYIDNVDLCDGKDKVITVPVNILKDIAVMVQGYYKDDNLFVQMMLFAAIYNTFSNIAHDRFTLRFKIEALENILNSDDEENNSSNN